MTRSFLLVGAALALAGCILPSAAEPQAADANVDAPVMAHPDESAPPARVEFVVPTPSGGLARVAALAWVPPAGAETVLLALHGSGGSKADWGPLPTPGYSFAHAHLAHGRAVVAIDFPGYADSPPLTEPQTMEALAFVVDGVARELRAEHRKVVGHGLSMGALVAQVAQAQHGSFDALVSAGWSHGGFSEEYRACLYRDERCPDPPYAEVWHVPNLEPDVERHIASTRPNRLSPEGRASIHLWGGCLFHEDAPLRGACLPLPADAPRPGDLVRAVRVPVLLLFGSEDRVWAMERVADEPARFASAPSVTLEVVPDAGHFVRWHRTNADADARLLGWLGAHGF